jgi:hypothetical protein
MCAIIDFIQFLLENGAQTNLDKDSLLVESCKIGASRVVQNLVLRGCDVNAYSGRPLMEAFRNGHIEIYSIFG